MIDSVNIVTKEEKCRCLRIVGLRTSPLGD